METSLCLFQMKQPRCLALELYIRSLVWFMDGTQMDGEKDKKKLASMATVTT